MRVMTMPLRSMEDEMPDSLEQGAISVNRHPGLDPGSIFFHRIYLIEEQVDAMIGSPNDLSGGQVIPIIKSGMTEWVRFRAICSRAGARS